MDIGGEKCPSDVSTGEGEIVSTECQSNMDLDTRLEELKDHPLMSPGNHDLPAQPLSTSGTLLLSPLWNFPPMSSPPLSALRNFSGDNPLSSSDTSSDPLELEPLDHLIVKDMEGEERLSDHITKGLEEVPQNDPMSVGTMKRRQAVKSTLKILADVLGSITIIYDLEREKGTGTVGSWMITPKTNARETDQLHVGQSTPGAEITGIVIVLDDTDMISEFQKKWSALLPSLVPQLRRVASQVLPVDRVGKAVFSMRWLLTSPNIIYGYDSMEECFASKNGRKVIHHPGQSLPNAVAFSEREGTGTGGSLKITHRKRRKIITLEMVQQHFNQSLEEAAKSLDVSKSTLKRRCRELGIPTWPSKMMMGEGPVPIGESVQNAGSYITKTSRLPSTPAVLSDQLNSEFHVEKSRPACYQQQNFLSPSTAPDPSTDQFTPEMPGVVTLRQDNLSSVMTTVKAAYKGSHIIFEIDLTAGRITDQLKDGVAKKLQLRDGSYEMLYKDDDDDLILICDDEDVHRCIYLTPLGSMKVKLYLRDK